MSKKDKRSNIRVPLLDGTICKIDKYMLSVADITNQGLFVKDDDLSLILNTIYEVELFLPSDLGGLQVPGKIVRCSIVNNKKKNLFKGYGIEFQSIDDNIKKVLDAFVVYLRNKQIINVSKRIIEEFFGIPKPKGHI